MKKIRKINYLRKFMGQNYYNEKSENNEITNSINDSKNNFVPFPWIKDVIIKCINELDKTLIIKRKKK